jgi:hypothetical protein
VEEGRRRLLPGAAGVKRFLIIEDGHEYSNRFGRFLSSEFEFVRASCFNQAVESWRGCAGLLLDLDFRRTPPPLLVDAAGAPAAHGTADVQGILILSALRKRGCTLPALLFADFDDNDREVQLEKELSPLGVIESSTALPIIALLLRQL